ncbi:baculoviral IAP repeat-containing protein 7-like [Mercenaria mercenaria]|uniref:baculoviral IAP repeat-containing protein 7-like n=1 Tax=Mercenaria mercenaria TaxID=6596 RepID=UPI00234E3990|nr:baculoviral IAP repeat-containing protein 7-like [Mercenaria mercenaria]
MVVIGVSIVTVAFQHKFIKRTLLHLDLVHTVVVVTSTPVMVPPIPVPFLANIEPGLEEIVEENRKMRELTSCIYCKVRPREVVYIPCGHLLYCYVCDNLRYPRNCPLCDARIRGCVYTGH